MHLLGTLLSHSSIVQGWPKLIEGVPATAVQPLMCFAAQIQHCELSVGMCAFSMMAAVGDAEQVILFQLTVRGEEDSCRGGFVGLDGSPDQSQGAHGWSPVFSKA